MNKYKFLAFDFFQYLIGKWIIDQNAEHFCTNYKFISSIANIKKS